MSRAVADPTGVGLADLWTAIAEDLQGLARLHDREPDAPLLQALRDSRFPDGLGLTFRSPHAMEAQAILRAALADLPATVDSGVTDLLAADYAAIYLHGGLHAPPCESPWLDEDGLVCQEPMFQVRACYRDAGLAVENWRQRPDDHLTHELQFVAYLCERSVDSGEPLTLAARFLDEHVLRWVDRFAARVAQRCETAFFAGLALLTAAYLDELRDVLAEALGTPRPTPDALGVQLAAGGRRADGRPPPCAAPDSQR